MSTIQAVPDKDFFYDFDFEFSIPDDDKAEKIAKEAFIRLNRRGREFLKLFHEFTPYSSVYVINAIKEDKLWLVADLSYTMGAITKVEYKEECAGGKSSTGFEYLPGYVALNLRFLD